MTLISKHISYKEGVNSATAIRRGINNVPTEKELESMRLVAEKVFEPARVYFGKPIRINSFFRCSALNIAVGGSSSSQHCKGEAIDMDALGFTNAQLFHYIKDNLEFDQLIWESGTDKEPDWVHVSFTDRRLNRRTVYRAVKGRGYIRY